MKIAFLMRRPAEEGRSITTDVVQLLRDWRATVDLIHLDSRPSNLADIRPEHDLYVLRTVTDASLSVAGILERQGARCVNPASVSGTCRDKALVTALLTEAGIPVPESWIVERPFQLAPLLEDGPMVIKPLHGSQVRGVRVVWDLDELLEVGAAEVPLIAQRYQPHQGRDRKLYCIGGQFFGVKRKWPATTYEQKQGEPFTITPELHAIALAVGQVIGTDLFGLDIVVGQDGPYVVDVNPFPGFKGVPDAALRLADYIYATATEEAGLALARKAMRS
jgi:ribosomal protein S6--L-glutamate ligase